MPIEDFIIDQQLNINPADRLKFEAAVEEDSTNDKVEEIIEE